MFDGYAAFYKMPMTDEIAIGFGAGSTIRPTASRRWSRGHARAGWSASPISAACRARSTAARPASSTTCSSIPALRGGRIADRLIAALTEIARRRGWTVIRWLTADDNYRARGVCDRHAKRTMWIAYQIDL
jgi:GNAT superfamily N-acetyltransferase